MPDRLPTIWDIDPHTKAKHFILKRPLGGGFQIPIEMAGSRAQWRGQSYG